MFWTTIVNIVLKIRDKKLVKGVKYSLKNFISD